MPGHAVTLIIDGEVDTRAAEATYGVRSITFERYSRARLRRLGFGWGTTKMLAFWYSPSEQFLYLDSDAVLWGNVAA